MHKFVFVVLCALLVGGALGEAALGNYYKDVVREQHKLINEMNQNFTELEKASEKLIDLGFYVGKHQLPPKTVKITKTVAVKVPVPFPVKVPEPVPVPVPVSKPVPVPVPTLVAIPVESTVATVAAVTLAGSTSASGPSPSPVPADADPASSQAHASTVQVQEYVQSFPIHSVYDAGDDYNPMEGNRLALAEHTASPTESTFSKPSPSSLQQLEEYHHQQQHHQHQRHHHAQHHSQQPKHHQHQSATQTGSHASAEQYYGGHGTGGGGQRQYYVGGAQVQAGAHPAAKFRPESHALQSAAESYDFGDAASQFHPTAFARATDSPYTAASGLTGGKPAPSASSAIGEDYRFASEQQHQQQQQFHRGQHGESNFQPEQFGRGGNAGGAGRGGAGESSGGRIFGAALGGIGGAGSDPQASAHTYVKFGESAAIQQADHQAVTVPRFEGEGETRLQAGFEAGFQEGLQATHQAGLEAGLAAGLRAGLEAERQAEQAAEKGAHRAGAGTEGKEINDLTPRPFQTVRESYPRYEKPDFARYHAESADHHHQSHHHHAADHPQQSVVRGGSGTGSILAEGYDHPAFAKSNRPAAGAAASSTAGALPTAPTHGYAVSGQRPIYPPVSTAGYHHSYPHPAHLPGEAHQDLRDQADATGAERFPFYHATKHDPHLARPALKPYHADAAAGGPSYQLQQQYGEHQESQTGGSTAQTANHGAGGHSGYTEHHNFHHHHHYLSGQQHGRPKHKGSYGVRHTVRPTVFSVPSDAHLYPGYNQHEHQHGSDGADNHAGTSGKFHYHFHNVHPVGGGDGAGSGPDHHQPAASEQYTVRTEYGGVAGPDGSVVTSYDPPASGNTFHFHDDGTGDMFAGASTVQEQIRAPYEEESSQ